MTMNTRHQRGLSLVEVLAAIALLLLLLSTVVPLYLQTEKLKKEAFLRKEMPGISAAYAEFISNYYSTNTPVFKSYIDYSIINYKSAVLQGNDDVNQKKDICKDTLMTTVSSKEIIPSSE
ncbi:MAG: prepilin-type N-terminal cleavage/methylation domain-containing protein, partial [Bacilli bacterium]